MTDVKCGKAKCLHESETAEVIDEVFANDNSSDKLVAYVDESESEDGSVVSDARNNDAWGTGIQIQFQQTATEDISETDSDNWTNTDHQASLLNFMQLLQTVSKIFKFISTHVKTHPHTEKWLTQDT
jgi:hypothetical protein